MVFYQSTFVSRQKLSGLLLQCNKNKTPSCFRQSLPNNFNVCQTYQPINRFSSRSSDNDTSSEVESNKRNRRILPNDGITLSHFIHKSNNQDGSTKPAITKTTTTTIEDEEINGNSIGPSPCAVPLEEDVIYNNNNNTTATNDPHQLLREQYLPNQDYELSTTQNHENVAKKVMKFHMKTYGCQMNVNDSDIVRSILLNHNKSSTTENDNIGDNEASSATNISRSGEDNSHPNNLSDGNTQIFFEETDVEMDADVLLTNTCAIRENAEQKVWNRLRELRAHDRKNPLQTTASVNTTLNKTQSNKKNNKKRIIGVLGCMAERLKEDMFKDGTADVIVGPDAYRDLPSLLSSLNNTTTTTGEKTATMMNVQLSMEETYADIQPVRTVGEVSAFVSVMRGCNNMCSYCVVPFTRGRERSRQLTSIVDECYQLYNENNVKEIILLGQNVNSYHDKPKKLNSTTTDDKASGYYKVSNEGFTNMFRLRDGNGARFADLVEAVSDISPELRVRFTSPHPKDYPSELLALMAERSNVCNQLHMPAQSGSTSVLKRMRRGYSREAYLQLIHDVKSTISDVAITSDFITGFCDETEEEHFDTISLMEEVQYDQAFMFAYSMRGKTHAARTMSDNVPEHIKSRRLSEIISTFRSNVQTRNEEMELGKLRLVLVEGKSRKKKNNNDEPTFWNGRTDQNKRILFPQTTTTDDDDHGVECWTEESLRPIFSSILSNNNNDNTQWKEQLIKAPKVLLQPNDYAVVQVTEARGHTLRGKALWRGSIKGFNEMGFGNNSNHNTIIERLLLQNNERMIA